MTPRSKMMMTISAPMIDDYDQVGDVYKGMGALRKVVDEAVKAFGGEVDGPLIVPIADAPKKRGRKAGTKKAEGQPTLGLVPSPPDEAA